MSYDVTGGGPLEAPIVDLSVPALKLIHKNVKKQKFYSLWLLHCTVGVFCVTVCGSIHVACEVVLHIQGIPFMCLSNLQCFIMGV